MTVIDLHTMRESSPPPFSVICLGNFDGVHIGHQRLMQTVKEKTAELSERFDGIAGGVCFFRSPPANFFAKDPPPQLMTFQQKLSVFAALGMDFAFVTDFEELRSASPEAFVTETLKDAFHCVFSVCGFNFHFGKNASGTADDLVRLMDGNAAVVAPVQNGGTLVSSSRIRQLLAEGSVEHAASLLGRPYFIEAEVLHGKALGRKLGIPTINQQFPEQIAIPKHGIYVSKTHVNGVSYPSVSNIGIRPSVDDGYHVNCETHVLGWNSELYGQTVKVEFLKQIRDELRFDSLEELRAKIQSDISEAKAYYEIL